MGTTVKPKGPRLWYVWVSLTLLGLTLMTNFEYSTDRAYMTEEDLVPIDFPVFYVAGRIALQNGTQPLYYPPADRSQGYRLLHSRVDDSTAWAQVARASGFSHTLPYTNPPFSALAMAPFAKMPWRQAYLAWQLLIITLTAAAIFLTLKLVPSVSLFATFSITLAAVCCFYPFKDNLIMGQVNALVLFLWALGVYLLNRRQPIASAWCFALGTVIKLAPVVAVPLLALRRQWRWLVAYAAWVIVLTGISVWRLGWQNNLTWLTAVYPAISCGVGNSDNRSLAGLIDALYAPGCVVSSQCPVPEGLCLFHKAGGVAVGLGFLFWCWKKSKDANGLIKELIVLPLVYLLVSPFVWDHHFLLAVFPLTYLWARSREATDVEMVTLSLSTLALGTTLPAYVAAVSPWARPLLTVLAIALWPAATSAVIWVGMRMYVRSRGLDQQPLAVGGQHPA
jgi:alpha-1,2-mannosyltransferase